MCLWVRWRTMPVRREWRSTASRRFCARWDFPAQLERDASCFSTGERRKVLLAASLCQQAHLYLWDEPLNYIDVFSRMQIEELLLEAAPSLLFVEHDTAFVNRVATGVLLVRR